MEFDEAKRKLVEENFKKVKLQNEERQKVLINKSEVDKAAADTAKSFKNLLINLPGRLSSILAAETNPREIEIILNKEFSTGLRKLAQDFMR